jgi:hypothetical protein
MLEIFIKDENGNNFSLIITDLEDTMIMNIILNIF